MSQDKELEIRRQFLEEAQEYLDTLDAALLGLANSQVDIQKVNAALRAAHSIKGGAGMMGYQTLSQMAHRLEDAFKVLKTQRQAVKVDSSLESLLLGAVSNLRQVIVCDRQNIEIDSAWFTTEVEPVFAELRQRLGEPQDEDATSILSSDEGQDILPMLFETEVEGCLERLETVLATPDQPCLLEELSILAQELGGLGEMLQLTAFSSLCESVTQAIKQAPSQVVPIAQAALDAWRRSQGLILVGQLDLLPSCLDMEVPLSHLPAASAVMAEERQELLDGADVVTLHDDSTDLLTHGSEPELASEFLERETVDPEMPAVAIADTHKAPSRTTQVTNFKVLETTSEAESSTPEVSPDVTVRVPVRQLNQLNDLFGELTIERNGLGLYLKRLRSLSRLLKQRMQVLEQTNSRMRIAYDAATLPTHGQKPVPKALPGSISPEWQGLFKTPDPRSSEEEVGFRHQFDALEMDRYSDLHLFSQEMIEMVVQVQEVITDIELSLDETEQTTGDLNKTAKQLQTTLTNLRMRPFADIVDRFPRAVREMSLQHGKPVRLQITGSETLIDRTILEALNDPLLHLVRNAFDHGIEDQATRQERGKPAEGSIEIQAIHQGNRTVITIRDDGGGIPVDRIRQRAEQMGLDGSLLATAQDEELLALIFEPGFSTSDQVTTLSGRGVGMDVVRDRLKQIRGEIRVGTQSGIGTTFTLSVPHTLSIVRILLVESNGTLIAIPSDVVQEVTLLRSEQVLATAGSEVLNWQGNLVPLVRLARWLQFNCARSPLNFETPPSIDADTVLLVQQGTQTVALQVDRSWGEQDVAIHRVEGNLPMPLGFSGCTILGDGRVVPLANLSELLQWIVSCERFADGSLEPTRAILPKTTSRLELPRSNAPDRQLMADHLPNLVMIVDDSINVRRYLALTLERSGYRVEQAKDGQDAFEKLTAGLPVEAVICDIEMPRLDGYGFLAKVRAENTYRDLPVVMLTSRSSQKHQRLAMSLGASGYFSKPYNEQELLQTLDEILKVPELV